MPSLSDADKAGLIREIFSMPSRVNFSAIDSKDAARAPVDFSAIAKPKYSKDVVGTVNILCSAGLLTGNVGQAMFNTVLEHQNDYGLFCGLEILRDNNLLVGDSAEAYVHALLVNDDPYSVARALVILSAVGLLAGGDTTQENRDAVAKHQQNLWVAKTLEILSEAHLLTGDTAQVNLNAVLAHKKPRLLYYALNALSEASLIGVSIQGSQERFNTLITFEHILFNKSMGDFWKDISPKSLTEEHWNRMMIVCMDNNYVSKRGVGFYDHSSSKTNDTSSSDTPKDPHVSQPSHK